MNALARIEAHAIRTTAAGTLTPEQIRFLWLHARHFVVKWAGVLGGGSWRAFTDSGLTATISTHGLQALIDGGYMRRGKGFAVDLTDAGRVLAGAA